MSDDRPIIERLRTDLTDAMKRRDDVTTATIRMVRTALTTRQVAGEQAVELSEDEVVEVLRSEAKRRAEAAEVYEQHGRDEAAASERAELAVIERYLPATLSDADLAAVVAEAAAVTIASGISGGRAVGATIAAVRERLGSSVDPARIAAAVRAELAM